MMNPRAALERGLLAVLLALSVAVFWLFHALPFQDLPGHAGLIAIRHGFAESAFDQKYFVLSDHLGPYTLFRTLGELFDTLMDPVRAVRLLATLPVIATPMAFLFARIRLFGDRRLWSGFYGVVLSFGLMTLFGFASYLLAVALLLMVFTLWLQLFAAADQHAVASTSTWKRELVVATLSAGLFLAHGHAYGLLVALVGLSAVVTGARARRLLMLRALVPSFLFAASIEWMERAATYPEGAARVRQSTLTPHFQGLFDKLSLLVTPTLMTRTGLDAAISIGLWALVMLCGWKTLVHAKASFEDPGSATRRHSIALLAGAVSLFIGFLILPHEFGWFGFIDARLLPVVLALGLIGIDEEALSRRLRNALHGFAPLAATVVVSLALYASWRFQSEARGFDAVLNEIPSGARLLNLPLHPNSRIFTAHPFVHYDKLAVTDREVLPSDLWFHQGTAIYPTPANPILKLPASYSESNLLSIDWPLYTLTDWDYALIRLDVDDSAQTTPPALTLMKHEGGWWLYRIGNTRVESRD